MRYDHEAFKIEANNAHQTAAAIAAIFNNTESGEVTREQMRKVEAFIYDLQDHVDRLSWKLPKVRVEDPEALQGRVRAMERAAAGLRIINDLPHLDADRINLDTLDMSSGGYCALAQAAGTDFGIAFDSLKEHGIDTSYRSERNVYEYFMGDSYGVTNRMLTIAYKRLLRRQRASV